MAKKYTLGIDLGGTKIHALVLDDEGEVKGFHRTETKADEGYRAVVERLKTVAEGALLEADLGWKQIRGVGLAVPGAIDPSLGLVHLAANLGWSQKPVGQDLSCLLDRTVTVGNDANLGVLGETMHGAAKGAKNVVGLFMGTGLGAGVVIRKRLVNGRSGLAGEIGHVQAPFGNAMCGCGKRGCLETVASKTGVARMLGEAISRGEACMVKSKGKLKSSELREAFRKGCPVTVHAIQQAAEALAWGLVTMAHAVDPDVFVLGGGMMEALGDDMLPLVIRSMGERSVFLQRSPPEVRLAALGDDAVAIGAAALAEQEA